MRVNLVYLDNGAGLSIDASILTSVLTAAGMEVVSSPHQAPPWRVRGAALAASRKGRAHYDLNIFLETLDPGWYGHARRNVLIPNQEWFLPQWARRLRRLDQVWCKTYEGLRAFAPLKAATTYVGFTSPDLQDDSTPPTVDGALHVAGKSGRKGTEALLRVWARNPGWPLLTVVQRSRGKGPPLWHPPLSNVRYVTDRVSDAELRHLFNSHWLHIRPSEAEGFGHPFPEAMSCGAVVVTTDAPPMNELLGPDRGILVAADPYRIEGLGMLYRVREPALEQAVSDAFSMPVADRYRLGARAREWFETNDRMFRERILKQLQEPPPRAR